MFRRHIEFLRTRALPGLREKVFQSWGRHILYAFLVCAVLLIILVLAHAALFGPPGTDTKRENFIVSPGESLDEVADALQEAGFVKYGYVFKFAYTFARTDASIRAGGYTLARDMDVWTVGATLGRAPYLSWITIPTGKRKEEVAELLQSSLGWTNTERDAWLEATENTTALTEGVFYADTYLIPSDQPPAQVAARIRGRFEEEAAPYVVEALEKKIAWADVVTLASIVEKESAKNDKKLVAGILWNRIHKNMLLQVDVTLQYMQGSEEKWWPAPDPALKSTTSPYNTYKNVGLPPAPIASPSLASIEAVLRPDKTSCLYYLHDNYGRIHCSTNYKAHLANVNRYLK